MTQTEHSGISMTVERKKVTGRPGSLPVRNITCERDRLRSMRRDRGKWGWKQPNPQVLSDAPGANKLCWHLPDDLCNPKCKEWGDSITPEVGRALWQCSMVILNNCVAENLLFNSSEKAGNCGVSWCILIKMRILRQEDNQVLLFQEGLGID